MASLSSNDIIQCTQNVFLWFGLPDRIVFDITSYLVRAEFAEFMNKNGIKLNTSALYHQVSNGLAEQAVKRFKTGMRKMAQGTLKQKVAKFLFSYLYFTLYNWCESSRASNESQVESSIRFT